MRSLVFAVLSLAFLVSACQPTTNELTAEQKAAIADTIRQVNSELNAAINARDLDSWLLGLSDDVRWGMTYGYGSLVNIEGLLRSESAAAADTEWGQDWGEPAVRVLGPDAAVLWGTYVVRGSAGLRVHTTLVYARVDGEWKIVHGHSTDAPPPRESM